MRALLARPALLLADDLGLGKTVQAIVALRRLAERGELRRALVLAPTAVLGQWRRALDRWAPALTAIRVDGPPESRRAKWGASRTVTLASYEIVRNDAGWAGAGSWDVLVLDEAQRIKNRESAVSQVVKRLPRQRVWALTGTPLENREDDLASILEACRPNPGGQRLTPLFPGPSLRLRQGELQLRRRKQDVLAELPPKTLARVEIELAPEQRRSYEAVASAGRREVRELGDRATVMNVLEVIARLKQVCNFCPESGRSAKMVDLVERLEEVSASGHRALVFSQYTSERFGVARIAAGLAQFRPLVYTGALGEAEREARIAAFAAHPEHRALVLSLRAGGVGLNLQNASYVVHFDRWWNPAVEAQATDRAHRIGQTRPVSVIAYTCADTVEERIEQILDAKRALFAALVDQVSLDLARHLTPDEIFGLIDLPAPARLRRRGEPAEIGRGDGEDPTSRVEGALAAEGWTVRHRPPGSRSGIDLKGVRRDEVGADEEVWVAVRPDRSASEDDVRDLEWRVRGRPATGLLAAAPGAGEQVRRLAGRLGVLLLEG